MIVLAIDPAAIAMARERIASHVVRTPLLRSELLDQQVGGRVFIKAENLQKTGSFKFRGAMNFMQALSAKERERGVIAFSSGNHALAVAEAARLLGCEAILVMPKDAPKSKISGVRSRNAEVILYDRAKEDREEIVRRIVADRGFVPIPPFDHPNIMAGQGTGAAEAIEQLADEFHVTEIDQSLICCSGGGLAAGWGTALRAAYPLSDIVTVEPIGFDDTARSLVAGTWKTNEALSGTICDALQVQSPGKLTLPLLLEQQASGVSVSDAEVLEAMRFAASELKIVLEPGGAAALAAVCSGKVETKDRTTLVIASGGNVDPSMLINAMENTD